MYKQFWQGRLNNIRVAGDEINADCPICHKQRHFYTNINTGQFDCKKCQITGNAITYLKEWENKDNKQIAECLNSYGINENNYIYPIITKKLFKQSLVDYYVSNLPKEELEHLAQNRGLTIEILKKYKVGLDKEGEFTLPVYDEKGRIRDIRRKRIGDDTISSKGASVFLFGIQDLLSNTRIYLTEGEWSKMALEAQGYASVGVPGVLTFKDEWIPYFKDKEVYIVYDLDSGGEQGSKKVVEKLKPVAKEIRVIHLPEELGKGKDIRDFFNDGYTVEHFERLIDKAKVIGKNTPLSLSDFLKKDIPSIEYYISGLLPKEGKGMISAQANIGKSIISQNLSLAMACGKTEFINKFDISFAKVLYLDLEMGESALKTRFQKMCAPEALDSENLYIKYLPSIDLLGREDKQLLEKWLSELQIEILIIDPLGNAWSGNPNDQQEVSELTAYLNGLIEKYGVSILVVHHWRKTTKDFKSGGQMAAGSYRWEAWLDCHITLEGTPKNITIACQKSRNAPRFGTFIAKINEDSLWLEFVADYEKQFSDDTLIMLFDSFGSDRVSIPALIERAKEQKSGSATTIRKLIKETALFEVDKEGKTHYLVKKGTIKGLLDNVTR